MEASPTLDAPDAPHPTPLPRSPRTRTPMQNKKAFTLLEILLVLAVISLLAGVVIIAINLSKTFATMGDTERSSDARSILDAVYQYSIGHGGAFPTGIDATWHALGTASSQCQIACGSGGSSSTPPQNQNFSDTVAADFNAGTYAGTQYTGATSSVELSASGKSAGSGTFTSRIRDAGGSAKWDSLVWTPEAPYGKELPGNAQTETAYPTDNANMTGNVVLYHLNESSSSIVDSSGQNNTGTATAVTYGQVGEFHTALGFNGSSSYVNIPNAANLNPTTAITTEAWVKWGINPATGLPWANIINKNGDGQYQLQHNVGNTSFEFAVQTNTGRTWAQSTTAPIMGTWYHIVGTWDSTSNTVRIYVNGNLENSVSTTGTIATSNSPVNLGRRNVNFDRYFNGSIDEAAIYTRLLSPTEIKNHYLRGALRLSLQARSCAAADCSGASFVGPDGTGSTYYSEETNATLAPPTYTLLGIPDNRYFQYRSTLTSDKSASTPGFLSESANADVSAISGMASVQTEASCLDLGNALVPTYLTQIPFDPRYGDAGHTDYAITKQSDTGRISVRACQSESGQVIEYSR